MIAKAVAEDISSLNTLINSAYRGEFSKKGWTTEAHLLEGSRTTEEELLEIIQDKHNTILKYSENITIGLNQFLFIHIVHWVKQIVMAN